MTSYASEIDKIPAKEYDYPDVTELKKEEELVQEVNLFELLRQQAKKKVQKKDKNKGEKTPKEPRESDIYEED